ncbi:MAG: hydantoinase B/oxoprolinase family protein, partial [Pirellula sp.]
FKAMADVIQVWCDVGGTFTDCIIALPDGTKRSTKVLSHGVVQGIPASAGSPVTISIPTRETDPDRFWDNCALVALSRDGGFLENRKCDRFRNGIFHLDNPLPVGTHIVELKPGIEAPVLATRLLLGIPLADPLPPLSIRLGTTRGTNALLTRRGVPVGFVITRGFADLLKIGYQERPELFALNVKKRPPLYEHVAEVTERLNADGSVYTPLDPNDVRRELGNLQSRGIKSLAVCLLHSYLNPDHEQQVGRIAASMGFETICLSSETAPMIRAVSRGETCVLDAYLTPVVNTYLERVAKQFDALDDDNLLVMTSSGGLVPRSQYRGKSSVLSGPAGGVVSLRAIAKATGISPLIGLDMGGTSTDVSRIDGEPELEFETIKAGVRMMIPSLKIHTVAAGGGSICWFDGVQLRVGPQSAGSDPGPACYGRGGPLTITDLNLLLDRIEPKAFPFPLDRQAANDALHKVLSEFQAASEVNQNTAAQQLAVGFRRIANETMANAVRSVSISQGADPRQHALVSFGGAAGQHICEIADLLEIETVIDPPEAGLLSALGMGMAQLQYTASHPIYKKINDLVPDWLIETKNALTLAIAKQNPSQQEDWLELSCRIEARYSGAEGTLTFDWQSPFWDASEFARQFHTLHVKRFGYDRKDRLLEIAAVHGIVRSRERNRLTPLKKPVETRFIATDSIIQNRSTMTPGDVLAGPKLVCSAGSTTYLERGWQATVLEDKTLLLQKMAHERNTTKGLVQTRVEHEQEGQSYDVVLREVLAQRFAAIAEQMGTVLEQTAISVNIKERRDFSCAIFQKNGDLIANAPHVPVHLGAMSATVKEVMRSFPKLHPGDCFVTNDPYRGGSHLPDVTVINPVFCSATAENAASYFCEPDFFVACRAHHAEIGGVAPGSMAPTSRCLAEEGVLIEPMLLTSFGEDRTRNLESILTSATYPTRALAENLADIAAQQAANQFGVQAMKDLANVYGATCLQNYMDRIQEASEEKTLRWIEQLNLDNAIIEDYMDDGTKISVCVKKIHDEERGLRLVVDFTGTGPASVGNLNANPAIVGAAVLYVVRCAIADDLPLNSGVMRRIDLTIPHGILNPARSDRSLIDLEIDQPEYEGHHWPAVAGGNVETSQRVVDCLLRALGLAAASQGTMNNFLFGDRTFGYYETICGGVGATPCSDGEDAVHTHMTNTRLTDVEILESRYPVRLVEFGIRTGSGGAGQYRGGCGIVRQVQALRPLTVSLVTSRRSDYPPPGLGAGEPGLTGENWLIRSDGESVRLPSSVQLEVQSGDSIRILTPGGGGYSTRK